jgi:hypothetical protein
MEGRREDNREEEKEQEQTAGRGGGWTQQGEVTDNEEILFSLVFQHPVQHLL